MSGDNSGIQQPMDVNEAERLKYLGFVQTAALYAIFSFSNLYVSAKDKSGPLKSGVESVEGAVKTVVGPVYHKFHGVPIDFLKFVDRKMDQSMTNLDNRIPPVVKQASNHALFATQKAPDVARSVVAVVQDGVRDTAKNTYVKYEPMAKELYSKYEPVAEQYAVSAWQALNKLPLFPRVADVAVPTAAYCSEKYNQAVRSKAENGYRVANYLPLVPTDKIAKVFSGNNQEAETEILVS